MLRKVYIFSKHFNITLSKCSVFTTDSIQEASISLGLTFFISKL